MDRLLNKKFICKLIALCSIVSVTVSLMGCSSSDTSVLSGTVESTQINITSEVSGKIINLDKQEGDKVKKGDVIAEVDSSLQEASIKQQEALIKVIFI